MDDPEVISLGCRLNAHEGDRMRGLMRAAGLHNAVAINSCAVTGEAVRQSRQAIRRARKANPGARIVVTGCAAQIEPAKFAAMPEVDAVLGNGGKLDAAEWNAIASGARIRVNDIMSVRETAGHLAEGYGDRARAFLEVQNGCDHRCTFCIIPFGRGNSRSAPATEIVDAARRIVDEGFREIVVTGVDLTSYGHDLEGAPALGSLVSAILDGVPDLHQLRLSSIDGAEIDELLLERIVSDERLAPHLHLSLQAGDDMILKRMKRRHTRGEAIELCGRLRDRRPEIAFGADIIAGFPTETEAMFQRSLDLVDEAGLQYLHVFPYSPRTGTPAARMPQVERAEIKARARRLRDKGAAALGKFLQAHVGTSREGAGGIGRARASGEFCVRRALRADGCKSGRVGSRRYFRVRRRSSGRGGCDPGP